MSVFEKLFGSTLSRQNKHTISTSEALDGKYVAIYFSAHWCPPCRGFTPNLAQFYNKNKAALNLEIVFVSSDRDEASFEEYFKEMPWLSLPYSDRDRKAELSNKFSVRGIPTLVILDKEGNLITSDGRTKVMADPEGKQFPWIPKTVAEILKGSYISKSGEVTESAFQGKYLGIYFSAHWCGPCRSFTPKLAKFYDAMKKQRDDFELLFVSGDEDEGSFEEYYKEMPWLAVPFSDDAKKEDLNARFEVEGIPHLVFLDKNLKVIEEDGRSCVEADPEGKEFPWALKPLNPMTERAVSFLNSGKTILLLTEGASDDEKKEFETILTSVTDEYFKNYVEKDGSKPIAFFLGSCPVNANIRRFLKSSVDKPVLAALDLPKQKKFVHSGALDTNSIKSFVEGFINGTLTE